MIGAIIIEDEIPARQTLKSYLKRYFPQVVVNSETDSVAKAIELLSQNYYDVIFLDIQLKDGTGLDILNRLKNPKLRIVFTTAYDDFTQEAFQYKAFGYLLKPLDPKDFKDIMNRVVKDIIFTDQSSNFIKVRNKSGHTSINVDEILRCEAESNYTKFFTITGEQFVLAKTLKSIEETVLPKKQFIRTHQSHLLNLNFVNKKVVSSRFINLVNGDQVPISRSRKDSIKEQLRQIGVDIG